MMTTADRRSDGEEHYAAVYIDSTAPPEEIAALLAEAVNGKAQRLAPASFAVENRHALLSLARNPDYEPGSEDFVRWHYKLEYTTDAGVEEPAAVADVTSILQALWRRNTRVVAACDFEAQLPAPPRELAPRPWWPPGGSSQG